VERAGPNPSYHLAKRLGSIYLATSKERLQRVSLSPAYADPTLPNNCLYDILVLNLSAMLVLERLQWLIMLRFMMGTRTEVTRTALRVSTHPLQNRQSNHPLALDDIVIMVTQSQISHFQRKTIMINSARGHLQLRNVLAAATKK
jgi:hypothetical protein